MSDIVKIAAVQIDPGITKNEANLEKILFWTEKAAAEGAQLIVFPECALTGYVFNSREEALPFMETIPGPATDRLADLCRELGVHAVFGLLEVDGDKCYNAAVLIGPQGLVGKYRKNHLPFLGIDRFVDHGNRPFEVHRTPIGNIGMHICYDCQFPESARIMTLQGADILALPTNWPGTRDYISKYVINTRAIENKVHVVAVDRVGVERGVRFLGRSKIVDAWGDTLASGSARKEEILLSEVSLEHARQKHIIIKQGEFEVDYIRDRRPEIYGDLTKPDTSRS
ncbi:MAG TPA: carbon-nitrogen hydrolase family protein [Dehalococcoidales bacterium]|nr:carbon-nitrogen hydrolase family protein [Dehalococcoidales bacterium]